jgi:hypothetical protein
MVPILACATCVLPVLFIRGVLATDPSWRKALAFRPTADYLIAAGLPL